MRASLGIAAAVLFFLNGFVQLYRLAPAARLFSLEFFLFMVASVIASAATLVRVIPGDELTAGRRRLYWAAMAIGLGMFGSTGQLFVIVPTVVALGAALLDGPNTGAELVLDAGVVVAVLWISWLLFTVVSA